MKKLVLGVLSALLLTTGLAQAETQVQVGRLSCDVEGGVGLIVGSSKDMTCRFIRKGHKTEVYDGTIDKLGFDIGITGQTHIEWLVFAASSEGIGRRALRGQYVGASGEATLGLGLGSNWLVGGSRRAFALQPWSIQAQTGINLSLTFSNLTLR